MDIVMVLDGSNSIYPWYEVQDFLIKILEKFSMGPGQTQVAVRELTTLKLNFQPHQNDWCVVCSRWGWCSTAPGWCMSLR